MTGRPWLVSPANESQARFSPDSRWVAFESNTSGQVEIYVSPLEGGAERMQLLVSVNGGTDPAWSREGDVLFYREPAGTLMRVSVQFDGDRILLDPPERTVELIPPNVGFLRNAYDPEPGGQSVIAFLETGGHTPAIRVRTGWR